MGENHKPCRLCGGTNLEENTVFGILFISCNNPPCWGIMDKNYVSAAMWDSDPVEYDLQTRIYKLREALHNLVEACHMADNNGELAEEIDGSLMDAAWEALK